MIEHAYNIDEDKIPSESVMMKDICELYNLKSET